MTRFPSPFVRLVQAAVFPSLAIGLSVSITCPAAAQQQGITVTATGEAEVRPDTLVFIGKLTESAESADDAVVAFRDTRRRAMQAIETLDIEGLSVEASALRLSRGGDMAGMGGMMIMPGGGGEVEAPPGQLAISQSVTIRIAGIDDMEQDALIELIVEVADAAKEAGISVGEMTEEQMMMMQFGQGMGASELAVFRVSNADAAQAESAELAMAQARAKAERLAALAGVGLGRVTAITEGASTEEQSAASGYMAMIWGMAGGDNTDPLATTALEPVTVRTTLTVTFSIGDE